MVRARTHLSNNVWFIVTLLCGLVFVSNCVASEETAELDEDDSLLHTRLRRSLSTNFGKRITSSLVAELGKRPKEMYSFGIGKRSISDNEMEQFLEDSAAKGSVEHPHQASFFTSDKRDPYAFGLGKRGEYNFGLGKKRDPYAFGLGKRAGADDYEYAYGLGKKDDPYAFGLGKRDPYAFGLGKRDPYAFGLGKRDPYAFGLGKRDPYAFGLGRKRDPYSFGLGKRSMD